MSQTGNPEAGLPFITNFSSKVFEGSSAQVWSIAEDTSGLMYFGNTGAILQYDGVRWRKILLPGVNGFSTSRCLARDSHGRIFYGASADFGYLAADSLGQIQAKSLLSYLPKSARNFGEIWTVYPTNDGVYFQSREHLFRFTKANDGGKETWKVKIWNPESRFMYGFYLDGSYYVHESGLGIFKMINDSLSLIPGSSFLGKERVQVMLPYYTNNKDKKYLFGMFYGGFQLFDGKTFHPFVTGADSILKSATLYKGYQLKDSTYALATTGGGLIIIDRYGKLLQKINRSIGLQDESVYAVFQDSKGNIWTGLDNGISRIETSSPLTHFSSQSGIKTTALFISRFNGTLYLGTTNGLLEFNSKSRKFVQVPVIPQGQVFTLLKDNDQLLAPTDGLYAIKDHKVSTIRLSVSGDLSVLSIKIPSQHPNTLFCGTAFGISVFTRDNPVSGKWLLAGTIPGLNSQVWNLVEDGKGFLWAGTQGENVYRITLAFDEKGKPLLNKIILEKFGDKQGLKNSGGPVYEIDHILYFPTDSAIYRFNPQDKHFYKDTALGNFGAGGGLNEGYMAKDYSGRIWIRLGKQIRMATPLGDGKYSLDDKTALLPITDASINQFYPEKDSILWICTTEGLVRYDQRNQTNYDQPYNTLLRNIKAGSTFLDLLAENMPQNNNLVSYANNSIHFEYAAPFFDQEDKTKYETWLEGFDESWSGWGKNYYKEYTNLPEGKYKFHVRALNVYGRMSNEAEYSFQILPPWYRTWWAYTIFGLLLISILWVFIQYRSKRLLKENRLLEAKVNDRTTRLKQSFEELKATQSQLVQSEKMASLGELTAGIAHEIQNPLNFVNNFSDVNQELLLEMKDEIDKGNIHEAKALANDVIENEQKINHHGKRADAIVKGMLQHSRKTSGQKEPTDINALADEYLRLSYHGLRAKDKSFNATMKTDFDASLSQVKIIPQDIGRVILNLFNNAFYAVTQKKKLNIPGYEPTVSVSTNRLNGHIFIHIKDNGNGIPQNIVDKIFQPFFTTKPTGEGTGLGLSLAYDIVKAHGGELKVESTENEGSDFVIQLPVG